MIPAGCPAVCRSGSRRRTPVARGGFRRASAAASSGFAAGGAYGRFCLARHISQPCPEDTALEADAGKAWLSLRESQRLIEAAHTDLIEAVGLGHTPAPAAAWFLDNAYLIRSHLFEIRTDLPREYRRMLAASGPASSQAASVSPGAGSDSA